MRFYSETRLPFGPEVVGAWHFRPGAFARLVPPFQNIQVDQKMEPVREGSVNQFFVIENGLKLRWQAQHSGVEIGERFTDTQLKGPFSKWIHNHSFASASNEPNVTILRDQIDWEGPFLSALTPFAKSHVHSLMERSFKFREERLFNDLSQHQKFVDRPRLRIGITGASGVIGTALAAFLLTGNHEVYRFVRRKTNSEKEIYWDPIAFEIDSDKLRQLDVVIHLAGENIANRRWTPAFKAKILRSRVQGTKLIASALHRLNDRPRKLISASAIGFYGDTRTTQVDESSNVGNGFMARICQEWEQALDPFLDGFLEVKIARIGVVLTQRGGALKELLLPTRMGLGGKIGAGTQGMSWISLDDVVYSIYHLIFTSCHQRVFNLVAPNSVTQVDFSKALAQAVNRPSFFVLPKFLIQLAFGEMGVEVLLQGQRVIPSALIETGYKFAFSSLSELLRFELGLTPKT